MEFLTLKPEAFGLDISDLSLKIAKLKRKRNFFDLTSYGEMEVKPGIVKEGEIKDEKKLAEVIKEAIKRVKGKKIKTKYVVTSLPEEKSFLQVIQMPKIPKEDIKSAVVYEAENYIPFPIEQVYLDSWIIPPVYNHLDHYDVLIVAIPKKIVDPYLSCLKLAGFTPKAFEIESFSIARVLIKNEVTTSPILIIDLGATRTSFIIFSGYSLRFTASIPVSSRGFTNLISKSLNISFEEAERLKIKYGIEERIRKERRKKKTERSEIFEALIPALVDLIQQIKRYLEYYRTHASHEHLPPNGKGISKILLCGGGANLKGLPELLSLELGIPVEYGNPLINIPLEKEELKLADSLKYTTALGLALRGITEK